MANKVFNGRRKGNSNKVVAYAMPIYSINCFQLPKELYFDIDSMIARFWWGKTPEKRKISWVAWKKLVTSKNNGELGFIDLHLFSQALLANQVWKIIQRPHYLIFQLLKARYFRIGSLMSANRGARLSFGWNSLRFGRDLLKTCLQFTIGNGEHTKLGIDLWLPTIPLPALKRGTDPELQVRTLFDPTNQQWNEQQIHKFIDPIDHYLIHKIYLPQRPTRDGYIWSYTRDGNYTVKSGYWKEIEMNLMDESPTHLWQQTRILLKISGNLK